MICTNLWREIIAKKTQGCCYCEFTWDHLNNSPAGSRPLSTHQHTYRSVTTAWLWLGAEYWSDDHPETRGNHHQPYTALAVAGARYYAGSDPEATILNHHQPYTALAVAGARYYSGKRPWGDHPETPPALHGLMLRLGRRAATSSVVHNLLTRSESFPDFVGIFERFSRPIWSEFFCHFPTAAQNVLSLVKL